MLVLSEHLRGSWACPFLAVFVVAESEEMAAQAERVDRALLYVAQIVAPQDRDWPGSRDIWPHRARFLVYLFLPRTTLLRLQLFENGLRHLE